MRGNGQMDLMFGGKAVGFAGASLNDIKKEAADYGNYANQLLRVGKTLC